MLRDRHRLEAAHGRRVQRRIRKEVTSPVYRDLSEAIARDVTVMQIVGRDGDRCYLCRRTFPAGAYEIEHIIPRLKGGDDTISNLAVACRTCNLWKRDRCVSLTIAERMPCFW